jgi:hypothetical protein
MPDCAGDLARLLDADLLQAGWDPEFIGPRTIAESAHQSTLGSLRGSLLKKYISYEESNQRNPERERKALDLFLSNNEDCRSMRASLEERLRDNPHLQIAIGEVKSVLDDFAHPEGGRGILLSLGTILAEGDVGPGSNIGAFNTDFYTKLFSSTLTSTTSVLYNYYTAHISANPTWLDAEKSRLASFGVSYVPGSKLFFAPKTREIARVACTEPTLNMFFQKGIQSALELRLKQVFGIDLRGRRKEPGLFSKPGILPQQDKNRELARLGSINGSFGTIDLTSASDRISMEVVDYLFPESIVRWLRKTRSPTTTLPCGESVELYMVSSMGNAFTFPLETAIFASVVVAAYRVLGIKPIYPRGTTLGNFAVFGDDIIVVSEAYNLVCEMLDVLGHRVNHDKSFNAGLFRESCGSDWFAGHNVRGVYLKRLHNDGDFYKAINRLNIWSGEHSIPLERAVRYLLEQCKRRLFVPMHEQDTSGIRVPKHVFLEVSSGQTRRDDPSRSRFLRKRGDKEMAVQGGSLEYRCLVPHPIKLDLADVESLLRFQLRSIALLSEVFPRRQVLYEKSRGIVEQMLCDSGLETRVLPRFRGVSDDPRKNRGRVSRIRLTLSRYLLKFRYNGSGVLLSAIAGRLRDRQIVIREFSDRPVIRTRSSPCWDYCGPELGFNTRAAEGFRAFSAANLGEVSRTPKT